MHPTARPIGERPNDPPTAIRSTAVRVLTTLMLVEAASLAVASALHLSGHVSGRGVPFDADHAGIAEAIIGTVLVVTALAMLYLPERRRLSGFVGNGFATFGFLWGLNITARGGHWPDIAYHLVVLPFLIGGLVATWRMGDRIG